MKVLIVNGSPHIEGGCTDRALSVVSTGIAFSMTL